MNDGVVVNVVRPHPTCMHPARMLSGRRAVKSCALKNFAKALPDVMLKLQ